MSYQILKKPVITEKSEMLSENVSQFTFVVDKRASKPEIKKAVEDAYGVSVKSVNTSIIPAKEKMRSTRAGYVMGRKSSYKKAIITLADGEFIDFYGEL
jgi:large subunit ribosomal protein L23